MMRHAVILSTFCAAAVGAWAAADEAVVAPMPAANAAQEDIARWIDSLGSDRFAERQEATEKLVAAGKAAVEPVAAAADSDDLETPARCVSILQRLHRSDDAETRDAAKAALERLARSERPFLARRAAQAVREPEPIPAPAPNNGIRLQVQVGGFALGNGVRITSRTINGQRDVDIDQGNTKIRISDKEGQDITVRVTETVDGKEKTTESSAVDLDQLRKKHPEAAKLYEKYTAAPGNAVLQVVGGVPNAAPPMRRLPPVFRKPLEEARGKADAAQDRLADAIARLRKLAESDKADPDELRQLIEDLESARRDLDEVKRNLP